MKFFCATSVIALLLVGSGRCKSQGFTDLNFESARVVLDTSSPFYPYAVYASEAIPGWTAYLNGNAQSTIGYDDLALGAGGIFLEDANAVYGPLPIQGSYSLFLQGSIPDAVTSASLGQTGTIPSTAQSLIFWVSGSLDVSFDGQSLSLVDVSKAVNYTVYAANISAYAGETGQLLFTAPVNDSGVLDNIQFSASPVPEPGTFALCALGGLSLAWRRRKKSSK